MRGGRKRRGASDPEEGACGGPSPPTSSEPMDPPRGAPMLHGSATVGGPMPPSRWWRTFQGGGDHHAAGFAPPPMDPPRGGRSSHGSTTRRPLSVVWRTRKQRRKERGRVWREEGEGPGAACRRVLLPAGVAPDSSAMELSRKSGRATVSGGEVNEEKDGEAGRADKDGEGAGLVGWSRSRASSPSVPSGRLQCIITVRKTPPREGAACSTGSDPDMVPDTERNTGHGII
jgi:hypothetical protein